MKRILTLGLLVLACAGASAETLNLEQARLLALANSRSLAKLNLALQGSLLDEKSHFYTMLPSPSAGYSASMSYLDKDWWFVNPFDTIRAGVSFSVTQKLFEGGKSLIQKALYSIATESVRKDALAEYFNTLDAVDNAYYAVLEAAATLEAAESSLETALLSLSMAEIRQSGGMINQGDYLRALADKEANENSRNQARRNLALSMTRLRTFTGIAEAVELEAINFAAYEDVISRLAGISDEGADALYDEFLKIVMADNPSLAKAALGSQRAEKNLSIARRDYYPTINLTVFSTDLIYTHSPASNFSSTASGGVSISGRIPVDFWVLANRLEKSKIARDSAGLDYLSALSSLETDLQSALLNAFAQAESVLSSRRSLEYTEKHFEYVMERYRLSQSSVSDFSEASSLLINSRNNLIRASYGFLRSLSRLNALGAVDGEERLLRLLTGN